MTRPPKARIRASFERAASSYDSAAEVQRRICTHLLDNLPGGLNPSRVLDAGCGTGYALGLLHQHFPKAQAIALDFSPGMLCQISHACTRLAGDLEHLPLATASIDLYWSSLVMQWCDPSRTLAEASRVLAADGQLALATLGPSTFHELRHAFGTVDDYRHTLPFHEDDEIARFAHAAGLLAVNVEKHLKIATYPDLGTLLRAVKTIGANQLGDGRRPGLMSRHAFTAASAAFETLRTPAGLPLSYEVITLTAHK